MRFSLLSLLAVGMALGASAQGSQSTTTQTGTGNTSATTQIGTGHFAQVVQADGAWASVTQGVTSASVGNRAYVRQQLTSRATILQSGDRDLADVAQYGAGNIAFLTQSGSDNVSLIYQGRSGQYFPHPNFPALSTATNNTATVEQAGHNNGGWDSNRLHNEDSGLIYQGVRGGQAFSNMASVTQTGNHGQAWTSQGDEYGISTSSRASITQAGEDNDASTVQGYYVGSWATGSQATVVQEAGSSANMTVAFQGVDGSSDGDEIAVTQRGTNHRASVYQGVSDPTFVSRASFASASGNDAILWQEGDGNESIVYQGAGAGMSSTLSRATVTQLSDDNHSTVTQSGTGNQTTVLQD